VCLQELLRVLLHEVDKRYTGLVNKIIKDSSVIVVEVSNNEEELPHPRGNLILIVEELAQASDTVLNTLAAYLAKCGFNGSFQDFLKLRV